ncbi:MAG TPA: DUF2911 domain-containing protein [Chryseolinea sp.]|nr:DUF2911 domain-containing protein [Chryseolinea sp.]
MRTKSAIALVATFLCSVLLTSPVFAQDDKASRPSPPATATGKIGKANVTISYSSPSVKGRKVWGDLVPYGQVWRAGANEATIFETDSELTIQGKKLPAGKYSLFAIAGENEWTFIFNTETGQWGIKRSGEPNLDRAKDALTVKAKPKKSNAFNEKLLYAVDKSGFVLKWENLEVPVSVK